MVARWANPPKPLPSLLKSTSLFFWQHNRRGFFSSQQWEAQWLWESTASPLQANEGLRDEQSGFNRVGSHGTQMHDQLTIDQARHSAAGLLGGAISDSPRCGTCKTVWQPVGLLSRGGRRAGWAAGQAS